MTNFERPSKIKVVISDLKSNREKHGVTNQAEYNRFRMCGRSGSFDVFVLKRKNDGDHSGDGI